MPKHEYTVESRFPSAGGGKGIDPLLVKGDACVPLGVDGPPVSKRFGRIPRHLPRLVHRRVQRRPGMFMLSVMTRGTEQR
jgi:hypothetical protein